jgi:uncharacterized protein (TIGR01370 family)
MPYHTRIIVSVLILFFVIGFAQSQETACLDAESDNSPRDCIKAIENYVVYYGEGELEQLALYDFAIIQPETLTEEEIAVLTENGTLVVAYLSIGEVEPYREWYSDGRLDENWILGENENWGSYFIDTRAEGWQTLMLELAGEYLEMGFHGIFMDTVDTAELYPETAEGMLALIEQLRETYPDALLIQNRGFTILEESVPWIDAVMFEDFSTGYDFETETYLQFSELDVELAEWLQSLHEEYGLVILALDYAAPEDIEAATAAMAIAQDYGFISSVSEISLQSVTDPMLLSPAED